MEVNYYILIPVLIVVIIGIIYLIRRNQRDEKKFEKEVNNTETITDKHDRDRV